MARIQGITTTSMVPPIKKEHISLSTHIIWWFWSFLISYSLHSIFFRRTIYWLKVSNTRGSSGPSRPAISSNFFFPCFAGSSSIVSPVIQKYASIIFYFFIFWTKCVACLVQLKLGLKISVIFVHWASFILQVDMTTRLRFVQLLSTTLDKFALSCTRKEATSL